MGSLIALFSGRQMKVWSGIPVHIGAYLAKANRSRQSPYPSRKQPDLDMARLHLFG